MTDLLKMGAATICSLIGLTFSTASAWYLHSICGANGDLGSVTQWWCYYLCIFKTTTVLTTKLVECGVLNEKPDDKNCSFISDFCGSYADLPLLILSLVIFEHISPCKDAATYQKFLNVVHSCCFNGVVSLLLALYFSFNFQSRIFIIPVIVAVLVIFCSLYVYIWCGD